MNEALSREEELFDAARRIADASQRQSFLNSACDGDDALRVRIEKLLAASPQADHLFQTCISAVRLAPDESEVAATNAPLAEGEIPGNWIGPYRIAAKMGEGGCGEVYLAEQQQPVRRRVALKIIKLGMDTRAVIARFNAERQALAMMDHPGIAKVFDAGATSAGRPYFVMELVSGLKITEFCDKAKLDLRGRLDLFTQVCHAIQHAHQKGVVHRDIKPSNILVAWQDGRPCPKVIDFGIAKATEDRLSDHTVLTAQSQLMGTPAYMSPEQADMSGLDIDTRSDVYSLGALLYELLTGRTPFDPKELTQSGMQELRRTICEKDPPCPSALLASLGGEDLAAVARARRMEPHKLVALIRGDLDCIAMKALEKDRGRRFQTANGLGADIQRFLDNEPISARPPSRVYQFGKLARRNRALFLGVAAVAAALIAGLAASMWLLRQETQARRRAVEAEQREASLRRDAEAREKITQALMLLNEEKFGEAETIIDALGAASVRPEAAGPLRLLGEWHALNGRLDLAAQKFEPLIQIDQAEGWDRATLDFLQAGVTFVQAGDLAAYGRFVQTGLKRFAGTTNLVVAERLLKISLLIPPGADTLRTLEPWAATAAQPMDGFDDREFRAAWRSVSLALFEYRRGHYAAALEWCRECILSTQYNAPRAATAQVIEALCLRRLGRNDEARQQLNLGRLAIERDIATPEPGTALGGFWFDWFFARVLLREAESS